MQRVAFKMRLKPGCEEEYKVRHDALWPELAIVIRESGVRNYSIYHKDGYLFWIYVAAYSLIRFFTSFLRINEAEAGPLTVPQWIALGMLVVAGIGAFIVSKMPDTPATPPSRASRRAAARA